MSPKPSFSRKYWILSVGLFLMLPVITARAEKSASSQHSFSVTPARDWIEQPLQLQGVGVSYEKKGTSATFYITERNLDAIRTVDQLKWADLFSPEFKSIDIRQESATVLGGEKAKFCIYTLRPGEFKEMMEGKLPAKYIHYVLIHQGKLFSITFKDSEDGFALTYPSFLAAIRTLRFDEPKPVPQRKSS